MIYLALATHASLYPALLLPAMLMLLAKQTRSEAAISNLALYAGAMGIPASTNYAILGSAWISKSWGTMYV